MSWGEGSLWVSPPPARGGRGRCLFKGAGRRRRCSVEERIRVAPAATERCGAREPGALPLPWPSGAGVWGRAWPAAWPG